MALSNTLPICSGEKAMPSQNRPRHPPVLRHEPLPASAGRPFPDRGRPCPCIRPEWHGAQEAGLAGDRAQLADLAGGAQHAQLRFPVEAIAGLDLDGGDTLSNQGIDTRQGSFQQLLFTGCARRLDRGNDAATGPGHFFVRCTLKTHFEFTCPVAAENNMGMTVDQARGHQPSADIIRAERRIVRRQVCGLADPGDPATFDHPAHRPQSGRTALRLR